ncbi:MAG: hypothetical protein N2558_04690 [Patescibacteria group bacterium]|nr:hypothetical protein [Patescibacteria group bacterium]
MSVTIEEIKEKVKALLHSEKEYELAKEISNKKKEIVDAHYDSLIELLESAGLKKFSSEIADIGLHTRLRVTVPKSLEDKFQFFGYVRGKYGDDVLLGMTTINHNTLNSFYNNEMSSENPPSAIPGLGVPNEEKYLRISRKEIEHG